MVKPGKPDPAVGDDEWGDWAEIADDDDAFARMVAEAAPAHTPLRPRPAEPFDLMQLPDEILCLVVASMGPKELHNARNASTELRAFVDEFVPKLPLCGYDGNVFAEEQQAALATAPPKVLLSLLMQGWIGLPGWGPLRDRLGIDVWDMSEFDRWLIGDTPETYEMWMCIKGDFENAPFDRRVRDGGNSPKTREQMQVASLIKIDVVDRELDDRKPYILHVYLRRLVELGHVIARGTATPAPLTMKPSMVWAGLRDGTLVLTDLTDGDMHRAHNELMVARYRNALAHYGIPLLGGTDQDVFDQAKQAMTALLKGGLVYESTVLLPDSTARRVPATMSPTAALVRLGQGTYTIRGAGQPVTE